MKKYTILTGSRNNAGDYLIKYQGKKLLNAVCKEVEIVDLDRWEPLTNQQLDTVNSSNALILLGGPALKFDIYPGIYPLVNNLDDIKVPIITMGIGWKSHIGTWEKTKSYSFTASSRKLLDKINTNGYFSSVRDFHSLNALLHNGYTNFIMTGCPALYDLKHVNKSPVFPSSYRKIGFSLGVSFMESKKMDHQMKDLILKTRDHFSGAQFVVAFHHSIQGQSETFRDWLVQRNIEWIDISGGHEKLLDFYSSCDFHLGYRVHAHIFMCSISKPSLLIAEDGRGMALKDVIGGMIFDAFTYSESKSIIEKIMDKVNKINEPNLIMPSSLDKDLIQNFCYDRDKGHYFTKHVRQRVDGTFPVMKQFIEQLP